jgi:hypothetical protein
MQAKNINTKRICHDLSPFVSTPKQARVIQGWCCRPCLYQKPLGHVVQDLSGFVSKDEGQLQKGYLWQLQKGYLWEPQTDCLWQHRLPGQAPPCEPQTSHSTQYDPIQVLQQRPREAHGIVALGCVSTAISPPHRNRLKTRRRMKYLSLA